MTAATCEFCGNGYQPKRTDSRFCCARCKSAYHREHDPIGTVRSVRRLMRGRVSVVVWFDPPESSRAIVFEPDQRVVLGRDEDD